MTKGNYGRPYLTNPVEQAGRGEGEGNKDRQNTDQRKERETGQGSKKSQKLKNGERGDETYPR